MFMLKRMHLKLGVAVMISFMGFPYKNQIEEPFIALVYCMYSQQKTFSTFLLNFTFITATYLSRLYRLFVLKPQSANQSIKIMCRWL